MTQVLITAFEPYGEWQANASWLTLVELTKDLPEQPKVVTRLYPVDYDALQQRLLDDLTLGFDFVIHTGQAPGSAAVRLESLAVNFATGRDDSPHTAVPLVEDGPTAMQTSLPLDRLCEQIRQSGVPVEVSYHAGTYLCNAAMYTSLLQIQRQELPTHAFFVHLPLDTSQAAKQATPIPSLAAAESAKALRITLEWLTRYRGD